MAGGFQLERGLGKLETRLGSSVSSQQKDGRVTLVAGTLLNSRKYS